MGGENRGQAGGVVVCSTSRTHSAEGRVTPWQLTVFDDWSVHCHPNFDLVSHELTPDCACGPEATLMHARADADNWMYQHHSLDGREAREGSVDR